MRAPIRSFKDLEVWQLSIELFVDVTTIVWNLPIADRFVFETQIRRAARSVAANISEGHQRRHLRDHLRLLSYARGSLGEVETDLVLIGRTTNISKDELAKCFARVEAVGRKLSRLMSGLQAKD